jgi:hypothetical protein
VTGVGGLQESIERYRDGVSQQDVQKARSAVTELLDALDRGAVRAASRSPDGTWQVNSWVKAGILLAFRLGKVEDQSGSGPLRFFDKDTIPLKRLSPDPHRRLRGLRGSVHAAHVHQRGCVRR